MYYPPAPPPAQPQRTGNGFGVTALVLGIVAIVVSVCLAFVGLAIAGAVIGVIALVFGIVGVATSKSRANNAGKGTGITGIVLGVLSIAIAIASMVLLFRFVGGACERSGFSGNVFECVDQINDEVERIDSY